jgi:UDP-N-acetylmuramate--alanine ligase
VFLCDLYPAREQPMEGVSSGLISERMRSAGKAPQWEGPRAEAPMALSQTIRDGDVVITIGAGDITRTGPELLALLEKESE